MFKPCVVFTLVFLNAYCFFILSVSHHIGFWNDFRFEKDQALEPTTTGQIFNWAFYYIFWLMTVWSLAMMVFKSPGYIANNYRYDPMLMSPHDQVIYENLKQVLHSTY